MKNIFFAALMMVVSQAAFAQSLPADKITGIWLSTDSEIGLKFEIFKSDGKYYGKLLWASNMYEADGTTPKKDFNNPDRALQSRSRRGIVNVTNLTYKDGAYTDGKLYNPSDGDTYSLNAKLKSDDSLEFRGYIGISLFGKTMNFKRVKQ